MTERRPIPADFVVQLERLGSAKKLRSHYRTGTETIARWMRKSGLFYNRRRFVGPLRCANPVCDNVIDKYRNTTGLCLGHYKELRKARAAAKPVRRVRPKLLLSSVIARTAERFGVKPSDLTGPSRKRWHVRPRQVAFYLSHHMTSLSLTQTGRRMNRDHSTVMHGVEVCARLMREDREFRKVVRDIICALKGREPAALAPVEPIRLECMGHNYKRREPEPESVKFHAPWWEFDDIELLSMAVRAHVDAGGDFIEAR